MNIQTMLGRSDITFQGKRPVLTLHIVPASQNALSAGMMSYVSVKTQTV